MRMAATEEQGHRTDFSALVLFMLALLDESLSKGSWETKNLRNQSMKMTANMVVSMITLATIGFIVILIALVVAAKVIINVTVPPTRWPGLPTKMVVEHV